MPGWGKELLNTPFKKIVVWIGVGALFYLTFWIGVGHGRTDLPILDLILDGLRKPLSCNSPPQPPPSPTVDYYTVLISGFFDEELAINLRTQLATERINGRIMPQGSLYYVVVGKFTSIGLAQSKLRQIQQKGYPRARIVSPATSRF